MREGWILPQIAVKIDLPSFKFFEKVWTACCMLFNDCWFAVFRQPDAMTTIFVLLFVFLWLLLESGVSFAQSVWLLFKGGWLQCISTLCDNNWEITLHTSKKCLPYLDIAITMDTISMTTIMYSQLCVNQNQWLLGIELNPETRLGLPVCPKHWYSLFLPQDALVFIQLSVPWNPLDTSLCLSVTTFTTMGRWASRMVFCLCCGPRSH